MPWLNGRGESLEIASDRDADDAWAWRLAMAPVVADGPFSKIDGVDRQLVLVEGNGMSLTIDRRVFECKPLEIVSFRGDAMTSARLTHGPIRDINLMTRRGSCSGSLRLVREGANHRRGWGGCVCIGCREYRFGVRRRNFVKGERRGECRRRRRGGGNDY